MFRILMFQTDPIVLRKEVASTIRKNAKIFVPFIASDDIDGYCSEIENTKVWGGDLEVKITVNLHLL